MGPLSSSRPLWRYIVDQDAVEVEIRVMQTLQRGGHSESDLSRQLEVPPLSFGKCLRSLSRRRLIGKIHDTWYLARDQAKVIREARKRKPAANSEVLPAWLFG